MKEQMKEIIINTPFSDDVLKLYRKLEVKRNKYYYGKITFGGLLLAFLLAMAFLNKEYKKEIIFSIEHFYIIFISYNSYLLFTWAFRHYIYKAIDSEIRDCHLDERPKLRDIFIFPDHTLAKIYKKRRSLYGSKNRKGGLH